MSKIEWCDKAWNPITGCTPVSAGCKNCYATRMAKRLAGRYGYPVDDPFRPGTFHPSQMDKPAGWKKPRKIFVCSMGDLFHDAVDERQLKAVFNAMANSPQHIYLLLTKRPENAECFLKRRNHIVLRDLIPNLWLGVTVENADNLWRVEELLKLRPWASKLFVSVEPMLGPVNFTLKNTGFMMTRQGVSLEDWNTLSGKCGCLNVDSLDWVIVGGESGQGARPMHPDWARDLLVQCVAAGVPFFFKKGSGGERTLDGVMWEEAPS